MPSVPEIRLSKRHQVTVRDPMHVRARGRVEMVDGTFIVHTTRATGITTRAVIPRHKNGRKTP